MGSEMCIRDSVCTLEKHLRFLQKQKNTKNTKNALFLSARPASGRHPVSRGSSPLQIFEKPGSAEKTLDQRPSWTEKPHSTSVPTKVKNREARPHPEDFLKKNEKNAIFSCFLLFYKIFTEVSGEQRVLFLEKSMHPISCRPVFATVPEVGRLETPVFSSFSEKPQKSQNLNFFDFFGKVHKIRPAPRKTGKNSDFSGKSRKIFRQSNLTKNRKSRESPRAP